MEKLKFNASQLPEAKEEYVCWIDIMGTKNGMLCSVKNTSNFIFKMHNMIIDSLTPNITPYPCMDGAYISVKTKKDLCQFIDNVFERAAYEFVIEDSHLHQFLIRASVAFGPVIHGKDITRKVTEAFNGKDEYRNAILMGSPMINAITSEKNAPPFGLYIHETARSFSPSGETPFTFSWYNWFKHVKEQKVKDDFVKKVEDYFKWCNSISYKSDYSKEKINVHMEMFLQQFIDDNG